MFRGRRLKEAISVWLWLMLCIGFAVSSGADSAIPRVAPLRHQSLGEVPPEMGFIPPPFDLSHLRPQMAAPTAPADVRFDWRESGKVTPVKHQGSCGSCYAFAAVGNFESRVLIDGGSVFDFSENNVKECEWYGSSCGGGNYWRVASFLAANGTVSETCDPYVAYNAPCKSTCAYLKTLLDWRVISGDEIPSPAVLKSYLGSHGPVYTTIYAGNADAWYTEFGTYDGSYTLYYAGAGEPNHAVLIVGWDDTLSHAGGQGAWIVKNSWGTFWGGPCGYGAEGGYFTIAYGSAKIGSYSSFLYDWQNNDPNGSLLYYDEGGYTGAVGYGSTTAWGMCKFVPAADLTLERVEFWTADATTDVDVYVYDDFNGVSLSNLILSQLNSSFVNAGYHSVELASPPELTSSDDIYVVVKITDDSYTYPLIYDAVGPPASGRCYISSTGGSWSEWAGGDLGIRARVSENISCGELEVWPTIEHVDDVPADNGGYVEISWRKSQYDEEASQFQIERYLIWRKQQENPQSQPAGATTVRGAAPDGPHEAERIERDWDLVGTVDASGGCCYMFNAPTHCDSCEADTCWNYFFVSAASVTPQAVFWAEGLNSPVERGYSVDNLGLGLGGQADKHPDINRDDDNDARTFLALPEPNPGVDGFVIRFGIGSPDWVELEVHDITGRRVATLASGFMEPGPRVARWDYSTDGSRVAPGIYFVRLLTSSEVRTEKLVIVN